MKHFRILKLYTEGVYLFNIKSNKNYNFNIAIKNKNFIYNKI